MINVYAFTSAIVIGSSISFIYFPKSLESKTDLIILEASRAN